MRIYINNFIVNIRALKIKKRTLKRRYKNYCRYYLANALCKQLKWGCILFCIYGIELLEKSILSIRSNCEYINIVYQKKILVWRRLPKGMLRNYWKFKRKRFSWWINWIQTKLQFICRKIRAFKTKYWSWICKKSKMWFFYDYEYRRIL